MVLPIAKGESANTERCEYGKISLPKDLFTRSFAATMIIVTCAPALVSEKNVPNTDPRGGIYLACYAVYHADKNAVNDGRIPPKNY